MEVKEQIVLTPRSKTQNSTTIWIEREVVGNVTPGKRVYVAGGNHQGIVVNKEKQDDNKATCPPPQVSLEFRVYLVNGQTGMHTLEVRVLRFWFRHYFQCDTKQAAVAQEFFRSLIHPKDFPRDYVGFITKIMKLLQHGFQDIVRIELFLCQMEALELPERPTAPDDFMNSEKVPNLTEEKVIEVLENHYPNPITADDLFREFGWNADELAVVLNNLEKKGIIKPLDNQGYTRATQKDMDVRIVKQIPKIIWRDQPTVAIITAHFIEKLAVDAMTENKETFMRYITVGKSNVYTLGTIGDRRIVCTKLPCVGHTREAMTAAGSTTTRLLGTFLKVDHVILVGVGGGVPHFTDYNKHVRLGDVVISHPAPKSESIYVHCDGAEEVSAEIFKFKTKNYQAKNDTLQKIAAEMKAIDTVNKNCFEMYLKEGQELLQTETEHNFNRPPPESDKLYMAIGERDLIEVTHPTPQNGDHNRSSERPRVHLGVIGGGREIARSDHLRQKFSQEHQISAFVSEFDPVIESVIANGRESFIFVRGISDYKDGTEKTEWQPYAALAAASVTKAIICDLGFACY